MTNMAPIVSMIKPPDRYMWLVCLGGLWWADGAQSEFRTSETDSNWFLRIDRLTRCRHNDWLRFLPTRSGEKTQRKLLDFDDKFASFPIAEFIRVHRGTSDKFFVVERAPDDSSGFYLIFASENSNNNKMNCSNERFYENFLRAIRNWKFVETGTFQYSSFYSYI